eukprot:g2897.t1
MGAKLSSSNIGFRFDAVTPLTSKGIEDRTNSQSQSTITSLEFFVGAADQHAQDEQNSRDNIFWSYLRAFTERTHNSENLEFIDCCNVWTKKLISVLRERKDALAETAQFTSLAVQSKLNSGGTSHDVLKMFEEIVQEVSATKELEKSKSEKYKLRRRSRRREYVNQRKQWRSNSLFNIPVGEGTKTWRFYLLTNPVPVFCKLIEKNESNINVLAEEATRIWMYYLQYDSDASSNPFVFVDKFKILNSSTKVCLNSDLYNTMKSTMKNLSEQTNVKPETLVKVLGLLQLAKASSISDIDEAVAPLFLKSKEYLAFIEETNYYQKEMFRLSSKQSDICNILAQLRSQPPPFYEDMEGIGSKKMWLKKIEQLKLYVKDETLLLWTSIMWNRYIFDIFNGEPWIANKDPRRSHSWRIYVLFISKNAPLRPIIITEELCVFVEKQLGFPTRTIFDRVAQACADYLKLI